MNNASNGNNNSYIYITTTTTTNITYYDRHGILRPMKRRRKEEREVNLLWVGSVQVGFVLFISHQI